jgi:hypothetical protein
MMRPSTDQLDQISHAELVAMVKALISRVESLETGNRQLKAQIERLKNPPANSRNSSQPPSRDQKSDSASDPGQSRYKQRNDIDLQ